VLVGLWSFYLLRRAWAVRLTAVGYAVRLLGGVGANAASWVEVDEVVAARREIFPDVSKLGSVRAKWRDARLMGLMVHKHNATTIDEEFERKAKE